MSARTSAHLACEIDDYYCELISTRDLRAAREYHASQCAAIDRIEQIVAAEGIDCDFARVDGYLVPAWHEDADLLEKEHAASLQAGFADAEWLERGPAPWSGHPAIRYPRQARFHPLKYLYGLLAVLRTRGVEVYGHTAIEQLEEQDERVVAKCGDGRRIEANAVVVATNSPFHLHIPVHTKQAPYRTYVIAARVPRGSVPDALVWDTLEPGYHYVRIQPGTADDVLIVGGEDHKTGEASDLRERCDRLETWARALFPQMGDVTHRFERCWDCPATAPSSRSKASRCRARRTIRWSLSSRKPPHGGGRRGSEGTSRGLRPTSPGEPGEVDSIGDRGGADPGVERDAGEFVAAAEVLHVTRHPGLGLVGLAGADGLDDAALRHEDACATLGHAVDHAPQRRREELRDGLHREHEHAVAAQFGEPAEELDDLVHGGVRAARPLERDDDGLQRGDALGRCIRGCGDGRRPRSDGAHGLPELDERDVVERERAADARGRLGVAGARDAQLLAAALAAHEPGGLEPAQRLADRRAVHGELLGELGLGRKRVAGAQAAAQDLLLDRGRDPQRGGLAGQRLEQGRLVGGCQRLGHGRLH
jgi:glycine/D-amino acid oxidase-like deaminating enzyme